jgi:hypothetical protein
VKIAIITLRKFADWQEYTYGSKGDSAMDRFETKCQVKLSRTRGMAWCAQNSVGKLEYHGPGSDAVGVRCYHMFFSHGVPGTYSGKIKIKMIRLCEEQR